METTSPMPIASGHAGIRILLRASPSLVLAGNVC